MSKEKRKLWEKNSKYIWKQTLAACRGWRRETERAEGVQQGGWCLLVQPESIDGRQRPLATKTRKQRVARLQNDCQRSSWQKIS